MSILEAQNIFKSFGGIHALRACSLNVEQETITGLIGPNGSGKTTLFNVITGFERADSGSIRFQGTAITNTTPNTVFAHGIARTFQLPRIFPRLTVLENMHIAVPATQKRGGLARWNTAQLQRQAIDLLDFVGLVQHRSMAAAQLSYGQQKLLELASILIAQPKIILLDEPAGGINPTMITHLASRIRTLNQQDKVTFLIVEHNMEFVMGLCDSVTVLHRGETIATGNPEIVRKDAKVLEAYLGD